MAEAVVYPTKRNCAELVIHQWLYYRKSGAPGTYYCERCNYSTNKTALKEVTDRA
jgi:hypothetical protein|tara:strand:+ start:2297 stop:2461 length:165 start_codon:yes stop_codon:yes gene_type:complete